MYQWIITLLCFFFVFSTLTHAKGNQDVQYAFSFPLNQGSPGESMGGHDHMNHKNGSYNHSYLADPFGVIGGHSHHAGGWMISYKYMRMFMKGMRDGTNGLTNSQVISQGYMATPTKMTMEMHMLGLMYAPLDELTLMVMAPYVIKKMDHVRMNGTTFIRESEGIGDIKLTATYFVLNKKLFHLHFNFGISFPTGSIDESFGGARLPYPMQIGSGTFDLLPGITYLGQAGNLDWGLQFKTEIRLGDNKHNYTLGNRYHITFWGAYQWFKLLSTSVRINTLIWENIDGADSQLNPAMIPNADPNKQGGRRMDLLFGTLFYLPFGHIKPRLGIEIGFPIYQSLNGPQLETDWMLTAGIQWPF